MTNDDDGPDEDAHQLYDPDRMVPEDLDLTDLDVAHDYLTHPMTGQLAEDIGRSFRNMPAPDQQRDLTDYLTGLKEQRDQAVADYQSAAADTTTRAFLRQLLIAIDHYIENATLRMLELDD